MNNQTISKVKLAIVNGKLVRLIAAIVVTVSNKLSTINIFLFYHIFVTGVTGIR